MESKKYTITRSQKENELFYSDEEHAIAHGVSDKNILHRNRTISMVLFLLQHQTPNAIQKATVNVPDEKWTRRRRGSHDEKVPGNEKKFLINVDETKSNIN
jgi:hypothetical protein